MTQKSNSYSYLGNVNQLVYQIRHDSEAASYECLRTTADYLRRDIVLHGDRFPAELPEVYAYPEYPMKPEPLHILFRGQWLYSYFLAVVPNDPPAAGDTSTPHRPKQNSTTEQPPPSHLLVSKLTA